VANGKTDLDPFDYRADTAFLLTEIDRLTAAAKSALSCLADHTRTDTDRTERATVVLNSALKGE